MFISAFWCCSFIYHFAEIFQECYYSTDSLFRISHTLISLLRFGGFFFPYKNSDWDIFLLEFCWMKQCPMVWISRIREDAIPRITLTVLWPGLGRSFYCGFLFVLGKFPFRRDAGCRHFQKMLSAQVLQGCRRKGGGWGSVVGAQGTFGKTVTA